MNIEIMLSLIAFASVTTVTPGPNNIMLLTSGFNFGFLKTVPHALGISVGFCILLLVIGLGLGSLLIAYPQLAMLLKILGIIYLLYLSYRLAFSRTLVGKQQTQAIPLRFIEAVLFQWLNPKAWMMGVSAMTLYHIPDHPFQSVFWPVLVFSIVNLPCMVIWIGFGTLLQNFLSTPSRLKGFNILMGILLVLSLVPIINTEFQY